MLIFFRESIDMNISSGPQPILDDALDGCTIRVLTLPGIVAIVGE